MCTYNGNNFQGLARWTVLKTSQPPVPFWLRLNWKMKFACWQTFQSTIKDLLQLRRAQTTFYVFQSIFSMIFKVWKTTLQIFTTFQEFQSLKETSVLNTLNILTLYSATLLNSVLKCSEGISSQMNNEVALQIRPIGPLPQNTDLTSSSTYWVEISVFEYSLFFEFPNNLRHCIFDSISALLVVLYFSFYPTFNVPSWAIVYPQLIQWVNSALRSVAYSSTLVIDLQLMESLK